MKRVTVIFDDEMLYRAVKVEAARLGVPVKQVIGEALSDWLQRHGELSDADRERRREALALATKVRGGQSREDGSIERDLAAIREDRS